MPSPLPSVAPEAATRCGKVGGSRCSTAIGNSRLSQTLISRVDRMTKRLAVVTGGMGGLGEAISMKLHDTDHAVVVTYSPTNAGADDWLARMESQGYMFRAYPVDVADYDSCQHCAARIQAEVGPVDILVNNAGVTRDTTLKKMDKVNWDAVIITTRDSLFNMTK